MWITPAHVRQFLVLASKTQAYPLWKKVTVFSSQFCFWTELLHWPTLKSIESSQQLTKTLIPISTCWYSATKSLYFFSFCSSFRVYKNNTPLPTNNTRPPKQNKTNKIHTHTYTQAHMKKKNCLLAQMIYSLNMTEKAPSPPPRWKEPTKQNIIEEIVLQRIKNKTKQNRTNKQTTKNTPESLIQNHIQLFV